MVRTTDNASRRRLARIAANRAQAAARVRHETERQVALIEKKLACGMTLSGEEEKLLVTQATMAATVGRPALLRTFHRWMAAHCLRLRAQGEKRDGAERLVAEEWTVSVSTVHRAARLHRKSARKPTTDSTPTAAITETRDQVHEFNTARAGGDWQAGDHLNRAHDSFWRSRAPHRGRKWGER